MSTQEKTEHMYAMVDRWQQSGLSQGFCAGTWSEPTYSAILDQQMIQRRCGPCSFIELGAPPKPASAFVIPSGAELLLSSNIPGATLKSVVNL